MQFSYIHRINRLLVSRPFYSVFVKLPPDTTPPEILSNAKFYPYFINCRGAIDGSHFTAHVPADHAARYRNRKGTLSQNVLIACTFSSLFCYVLSGWEGSAADSQILDNARQTDFRIPAGRYYLADAGFPICNALMVPYRGVRYHLREWENSRLK